MQIPVGETKRITVNAETLLNSAYDITIGEYGIAVKARIASDDALAGFRGPIHIVRIYVTDPTSCFKLLDPAEPSDLTKTKTSFDIKAGIADGLIKNTCFVFFEDLRLPSVEKVVSFSAAEESFSLLHSSPTQPAEAKIKKKVFDPTAENFDQSGALEFKVTDSGGYVFVDWVDFFMTDKNHNGGDTHTVFAQTYRDVWSNITAQLPYTEISSSYHYVENCNDECVTDIFKYYGIKFPFTTCTTTCSGEFVENKSFKSDPIIDNLGLVDTETFYPQDALYNDVVTAQPIWQGQHNVCNNNLGGFDDPFVPCSVPDYFGGVPLTSYNVGMISNKIGLMAEQTTGTEISGLRWQYISTDKSHDGLIDFKVRNNTLMGETYAMIEVEDTTGRDFVTTHRDNIDVAWVLSKRGVRFISNSVVQLDSPITLRKGEYLGITVDESANPKYFIGRSLAQVNANLLEPEVPRELSRLSFTPSDSTTGFKFEDDEYISTYLFFDGQWSSSINDFDFDPSEPIGMHEFSFSAIPATLIAYKNNSEWPIVVDKVEFVHITQETNEVPLENGFITINAGAGEDQAEAFPNQSFDDSLPPGNYDSIEYIVESSTPEALVFFNTGPGTVANTVQNPYINGISVVAMISSVEEGATTKKERFHIRLVGEPLSQCLGYNGLTGSTGPGSKPRVLFDWDWNAIGIDSCDDSDNLSFIYCDPTQFTISLTKRLERMRLLAEEYYAGEDPENDNILQARELQTFTAYLVEDAYVQDFRDDFVSFFAGKLLAYDLMNPDHPWGRYLKDSNRLVFDTTQARFTSDTQASPDEKFVAAGLHEIYISLEFDRDQFDFFYIQGSDNNVVDLRANITVYVTKLSDPIIKSPFYYLPFNGGVGIENGSFQRDGYGLDFDNTTGPIAIVAEGVGGPFYTTDSPQGSTGRKLVNTVRESSFESANFENRGRVMDIAQNQSRITFLPSIATPVLLEMAPQNSVVEAYYNIVDLSDGLLSSKSQFMNLWTGAGSSMRDSSGNCVDFYSSKLEYRREDSSPPSGSCAAGVGGSYGFNYDAVPDSDRLYFETVFYSPTAALNPSFINLKKSCDNASNFYAPGPSGGTQSTKQSTSAPVSLSIQDSKTKIATMQDVIDLVGQEYVCISSNDTSFSFWWNPQKVLSDLDSIKNGINSDWELDVKCEVISS